MAEVKTAHEVSPVALLLSILQKWPFKQHNAEVTGRKRKSRFLWKRLGIAIKPQA
jgi:hypothetical protein